MPYVVPASDIAPGGWGTTPLWSKIDNAPTPNDSDVIGLLIGSGPDTCDLGTTAPAVPSDKTGWVLGFRARRNTGDATSLNMRLFQGATEVKSSGNQAVTASLADYTFALSEAEAEDVTDFATTEFQLTGAGGGLGGESPSLKSGLRFQRTGEARCEGSR